MGSLAAIGVFYKRPEFIPVIAAALRAQTRPADELVLTCETRADLEALVAESWPGRVTYLMVPMPDNSVPPSVCINAGLDATRADYITYFADDSLPAPRKFELMMAALETGANAAYCSQDRAAVGSRDEWLAHGGNGYVHLADHEEPDPYMRVDMSQVMHRRTTLRWPLDPGVRKIGDAVFFRDLVAEQGPLQPVPEVLDWHRQLPDGITAKW